MPQSRNLPPAVVSSRVLIRFGVRMIVLMAFAASSSVGFARGLATLMLMAITWTALVAAFKREQPFEPALNYWDEMLGFTAAFCLISIFTHEMPI